MKRVLGLLAATLFCGSVAAQDIPLVPLVPGADPALVVDPAGIAFDGIWEYSSDRMSGLLEITRAEGRVELEFVSGAVCDPEAMCRLSGAIEGKALVVSTSEVVDDEGGSATTALAIHFLSETEALGTGSSRYVHPEGGEMHWNYGLTLHRPVLDGGTWERGVAGARD